MLQIILFSIILLIILYDIYFLYNYIPSPPENKKNIINNLKDKYKKLIELKNPNKINEIQYKAPLINEPEPIPQLIHPQMQRIGELQNINSQSRSDMHMDININTDMDMEPTVINRNQQIISVDRSVNIFDKSDDRLDRSDDRLDRSDNRLDRSDNRLDRSDDRSDERLVNMNDSPDINKFGKPYEYEENKYIVWEFMDPAPWSRIVYKYNEEYPYQFFIKVKIPSLNDYENWKNIITNLQFNPRPGELIIPTKSEESAIAIANLIISNFGGSISLDDIIKKDLIGISIAKASKYEVVKNKLKEQIISMLKPPPLMSSVDFQQDLASGSSQFASVEQKKDIEAWEGSEFAFI
jgi:hypothetical protein